MKRGASSSRDLFCKAAVRRGTSRPQPDSQKKHKDSSDKINLVHIQESVFQASEVAGGRFELDPQDLRGGRRTLTPGSYPVIFTYRLQHAGTYIHKHTYIHKKVF